MAPRGERRHLQTPPQKGASQELAPILGGKSSGPAQLSFGASTAVGEGAALDELRSARSGAAWVLDKTLREKEEAKWEALVASASGKAPPKVAACLNRCAPAVAWAAVGCEVCVPVYVKVFKALYYVLSKLPTDVLGIVWGLCLVFFGGVYPLTMAAFEAFRQCGGAETYAALHDLQVQYGNAKKALEDDDALDADGDGVADVEQCAVAETIRRKNYLVLTATDPVALDRGFKGLYTAWVAVIAVLKIQFAQMVALGSAIGDFLGQLLRVPLTQVLVHVMDKETQKWIPTIIFYTCKVVAIAVAIHVQKLLSAFYSAVRGGLLVSRNVMYVLDRKGVFKLDPNETYVDEVTGWALAAVGFYCQFSGGFAMPPFVRVILWPFETAEAGLLWGIMAADETPQTA